MPTSQPSLNHQANSILHHITPTRTSILLSPTPPRVAKMPIETIVSDPSLQKVLQASQEARQQAITLLDLISSSTPSPTSPSLPTETQLAISKQHKLLTGYLAQLRGLHRQATFGARDTKVQSAEARQEVDRLHLQLQNLFYEQRHLQGEIEACEAYEFVMPSFPSLFFS
jgi:THO complex subunit 5